MILIWGHDAARASVGAVQVLLGRAGEHVGHGVVIQRGWWQWQGDGDRGGMETAAAVARRGWWQWHGEGSGGSMERAAVVAQRGQRRWHGEGGAPRRWADSVGSMSAWAGSTLGL